MSKDHDDNAHRVVEGSSARAPGQPVQERMNRSKEPATTVGIMIDMANS